MDHNKPYQSFRISVPPAFEEVFSHFYYAENTSGEAVGKTLLPSYQTIMVFSFGAPVSFIANQNDAITIDKCIVVGPIKKALDYILPPNAEILVVNFKGDAFFRFFGMAAIAENLSVHPDELLDENCFTVLWMALRKIGNTNDRVNYLLDFCQPYLQQRIPIAGQIASFDDENQSSIKAISADCCSICFS